MKLLNDLENTFYNDDNAYKEALKRLSVDYI